MRAARVIVAGLSQLASDTPVAAVSARRLGLLFRGSPGGVPPPLHASMLPLMSYSSGTSGATCGLLGRRACFLSKARQRPCCTQWSRRGRGTRLREHWWR
jgi:hypothetical protein